jgi:hypothetical protein
MTFSTIAVLTIQASVIAERRRAKVQSNAQILPEGLTQASAGGPAIFLTSRECESDCGKATGGCLDHDAIKQNRIMISSLCLSMISAQTRFRIC